ncbi:MAG: D-tyrosyl-tRNA(Tyr) deacylase [Lachnospiraceae bacterium]|nr:D-tyrosyl-tRNA(Tyr) deacylase [Lachnospiraceae bacterium]
MRFVIQVVSEGKVTVEERLCGQIGKGYVVLIGVGQDDTKETADKLIRKMLGLRIFPDANGKTNLSLKDVEGGLLLISQFTLYADCRHGNRPSFINAGAPDTARELYEYIIARCREEVSVVEQGEFGEHMRVSLVNEGPFTILLDSEQLK